MDNNIHICNISSSTIIIQLYKHGESNKIDNTKRILRGNGKEVTKFEFSGFSHPKVDIEIRQLDKDTKERVITVVRYSSKDDYSWVVSDHHVAKQEYGNHDLSKEDPNGPKYQWIHI